MAIHEIEGPDGQIHEVEAPDNASPDQVMSFFKQSYQPQEPAAKEQGIIEGMATGGGEAIGNRGVGMFQLAKELGVPVNVLFGLTPEQFDIATQRAVKSNSEAAEGSGAAGVVAGMLADPLNTLPFGAAGKLALPAYGAASGFTRGEQTDADLLDRSLGAATEAGMNVVAGKVLSGITNKAVNAVLPKKSAPEELINTLLNENTDVKTYMGDQLAAGITGAERAAYNAKKAAYVVAEPMMDKLSVNAAKVKNGGFDPDIPEQVSSLSNITTGLKESVSNAIKDFDPEVVRNRSAIEGILNDFNKEAAKGKVSFDKVDLIRKRLFALPKANDAEAAVRGKALSAYHDYADNLLNSGLLEGDAAAIQLIKDANSKNAYWRKNFTSKEANNAIRSFIEKEGGTNAIAPENLLDKFINVGQAGYSNVRALKDVLGASAKPILQHGFYNKLRSQSLMKDGESIDPLKLSASISKFLDNNKTLAAGVFTPNEITALRKTASVADKYAKTGLKPKGVARIATAIPIFGPMLEQALTSKAYSKMTSDLAKPKPEFNIGFVPVNVGNALNTQPQ